MPEEELALEGADEEPDEEAEEELEPELALELEEKDEDAFGAEELEELFEEVPEEEASELPLSSASGTSTSTVDDPSSCDAVLCGALT